MENEQTNTTDTEGKEVDKPVTPDKETKTPADKVREDTEELKKENDAYDEQKLRAETIRAEKARGGKSEAGQDEKTQDEKDEEAAKVFMKDDE